MKKILLLLTFLTSICSVSFAQCVPSVTINANKTTICNGDQVTFIATPTNGGTPTYVWRKNGVPFGSVTTSSTYTYAVAANGDNFDVVMTSNDPCASPTPAVSNSILITVSSGIGSGTIGADQTICYNNVPAVIIETTTPTNIIGTPVYTWEASVSGTAGTFVAIPSASGPNFTFITPLTHDAYIRRIITDAATPAPCNVAYSNVIHITVLPELTAGVIGSDEAICTGAIPAAINNTTAPTGGTGIFTYQWQKEFSGAFVNIAGATSSSYNPGPLTITTQFQRVETSGLCGTVKSNVVTKSLTTPEVITVSINEPGQVCAGSPPITFNASATTTGTGIISYSWSLEGVTVGTNSATYTYIPIYGDNGKRIKVVVTTSNSCNTGAATSNIVTLDIVGATTPTVTISGNPVNCVGLPITFTATSTGGGSGSFYQWYVVPSGSPFGTTGIPVGTGGTSFTSSSLTNGDQVYVELTSSVACIVGTNPYRSNISTMNIKPVPSPTIIESDQTMCSPNEFTYHAFVGNGTTLQWYNQHGVIAGATNNAYTATQSGTYSIYEDNGICNSVSEPVVLTVIITPIANAGPDQNVFANSTVTLNASGGNKYSWSPSTYLSNTAIANPSLTADQTITYTVSVSDPSGICSTTDDVIIYVSNATPGSFSTAITGPNPVMPGQLHALYSVPNQTGFTYTWSVTGGTIVSGQNTNGVTVDWDAPVTNSFARTTAIPYSISVLEKNTSNQTKTTTSTINTVSTGVTLSQAQSGINVFPNPTTGSFNIEMPESGIDVIYDILDLTGLSVASGTFTSTGTDQTISADLDAGMYQIVLKYNNTITCLRLSKLQ